MMNKMVVANLVHRPVRSLISIVAIALEVTLILLIVGLCYGIMNDNKNRTAGEVRHLFVRGGEASYSIYMLHEIVPSAFKRLGLQSTDPATAWVTWAGMLVVLVLISLVSYALIERPARMKLRALLAPAVTAPGS